MEIAEQKRLIANYKRTRKAQLTRKPARTFPKTSQCVSTHDYVQAYYMLNNLMPLTGSAGVNALFEPLNKLPTTWPQAI
jgi:hypothetical protein